jgi:hypothetical protein
MGVLTKALEAADAAFEDHLSRLSDDEWAALEARVRPPKAMRYPKAQRANTSRTGA